MAGSCPSRFQILKRRPHYDALDWLVLVIVGLAAVIRFAHLGDIVLYWDEPLHSVRIAAQPLWFVAVHNDGSALFAMLVHFLLGLGGSVEVMSRLPSAVCGHVAVLMTYRLGKNFLSRQAGVLAALLMVFSPALIQYSQYSRMYGTYSLFSLLAFYFYYRALTQNRTKLWAGYAAATAANVYNHVLGLFVLPVFGLFTLGTWLAESLRRRGRVPKPFHPEKIMRFILWTLLGISVAALLYIPDKRIQSYLLDSVGHAVQASESPASFSILKSVLLELLRPAGSQVFWVLIGLTALGLVLSFKKHGKEAVLFLLYIFLPFSIFILIRPNSVTFYSAPRYFIFFLPLLFLYMGYALWKGAALLAVAISRRSRKGGRPTATALPLALVLTLAVSFFAFDVKGYYRDYWRLGTYRPPAEVAAFLRHNLKEECFFLADTFPATAMSLMAGPLTRDLKVSEIEQLFLQDRTTDLPQNRIMISRIDLAALRLYPFFDAPLLAPVKVPPSKAEELEDMFGGVPHASLLQGGKDYVFLYYQRDGTPLFRKVITVTEAFLRLELPTWKKRLLHWHAAQAYLLGNQHEEALWHIRSARDTKGPAGGAVPGRPALNLRILDRLFGLKPDDLLHTAEELYLIENSARLLFRTGNRLAARDRREEAFEAFRTCADISPSHKTRCSIRIADMAVWLFGHGFYEKSLPLFYYAAAGGQERFYTPFLALEALKRSGRADEARERAGILFPGLILSMDKASALLGEDPGMFLWREEGRLHIFFRAQKGTLIKGRIGGGQARGGMQSHWFRQADELKAGGGNIEFSFRMDSVGIKALNIRLSGKQTLRLDLSIDGQPAPDAIHNLN